MAMERNQFISSKDLEEHYRKIVQEVEWKQKIYENIRTAHMDWMSNMENRIEKLEKVVKESVIK